MTIIFQVFFALYHMYAPLSTFPTLYHMYIYICYRQASAAYEQGGPTKALPTSAVTAKNTAAPNQVEIELKGVLLYDDG